MRLMATLFAATLLAALAVPVSAGESVLGRLQDEIRAIAAKAGPAVVKITAGREFRMGVPMPDPKEGQVRALLSRSSSVGTGFLVSRDGLILATHRTVEGSKSVSVHFQNGPIRKAEILGSDPFFRVALLKVEPVESVEPLELAGDETPPVGSLGVFLGNSFGISANLSLGVVTGAGKSVGSYDNFLVMNAPVRPGDSGGPLIGPEWRVLGMAVEPYTGRAIHISIVGRPLESSAPDFSDPSGMGLVVPACDLRFAIDEIESYGRVRSGRLGVSVKPATLEVNEVLPGTPAAKAGLMTGDILVSVARQNVRSDADLRFVLRRTTVGSPVVIRVRRGEDEISTDCSLTDIGQEIEEAIGGVTVVTQGPPFVRSVSEARAKSGLKEGDLVLSVNGEYITSAASLLRLLSSGEAAGPIRLGVLRGSERIEVTLER